MKLSTVVVSSVLTFSATQALAQTNNVSDAELAAACSAFMLNAYQVTGQELYNIAASGYLSIVLDSMKKGQISSQESAKLVEGALAVAKDPTAASRDISLTLTKQCLDMAEKSGFFKNYK